MNRTLATWLVAACAITAGCSGNPSTQVLTGNVRTSGAVAVRAVASGTVVTASRVRSDGSFTLALPAGATYRLEVLSASGVTRVVDHASADITFRVCEPTDPFDLGQLGGTGGGQPCDPATEMCPPDCDPMTGTGCPPPDCTPGGDCPPPKCDPATDANCPCDPATEMCPPPPDCDPMTGMGCPPPDCTPGGDCPPPCDPMTDPTCMPQPPKCDPTVDDCPPPCDPMTDPMCGTVPPPCTDPMDPNTCKDACMDDPTLCACPADTGMTDPGGCWPPPCDGPDCAMDPKAPCMNPPTDFGCMEPPGA